MRKGRGVTNITGEKLTEDQVNLAVAEAARHGIRVPFYVFVAERRAPGYRAYIESGRGAARAPCRAGRAARSEAARAQHRI